MTTFTRPGIALAIAAVLAACGGGDDEQRAPAMPRPGTGEAAQPSASAAASPKWPKDYCAIVSAEDVAAVLGKPVTSRVQITTCDYLTGGSDDVSVSYWNHKGEFEIFKGLQDERGTKGTPVSGLGVEAMYGTTGTGAGLAVLLADGRAFTVVGRDRERMLAIAKLVVAKHPSN